MNPSLSDLRYAFFGGQSQDEYNQLLDLHADGVTLRELYLTNSFQPKDLLYRAWSIPPVGALSGVMATNGVLYLAKVSIRKRALNFTGMHYVVTTGAVLPTAGQNWIGLYQPNGVKVLDSDIATAITTPGLKTVSVNVNVTSTGTIGVGTFLWIAFVFNGVTPPIIAKGSNVAFPNGLLPVGQAIGATNGAGLTTMPASITPGNNVLDSPIFAAIS